MTRRAITCAALILEHPPATTLRAIFKCLILSSPPPSPRAPPSRKRRKRVRVDQIFIFIFMHLFIAASSRTDVDSSPSLSLANSIVQNILEQSLRANIPHIRNNLWFAKKKITKILEFIIAEGPKYIYYSKCDDETLIVVYTYIVAQSSHLICGA